MKTSSNTAAVAWPEKTESIQLNAAIKHLRCYEVGGEYKFGMPGQQSRLVSWRHWVFDDETANLQAEAFVGGASEMIDSLMKKYGTTRDKDGRIDLFFSHLPFKGSTELVKVNTTDVVRERLKNEVSFLNLVPQCLQVFGYTFDDDPFRKQKDFGTTYRCEEFKQDAWLCPALFCYFKEAPESIHARTA